MKSCMTEIANNNIVATPSQTTPLPSLLRGRSLLVFLPWVPAPLALLPVFRFPPPSKQPSPPPALTHSEVLTRKGENL